METKQKSISINLIANGIKTLMSVLFPLITFPYASRVLGAAGIGKVNYATSIISYFSMFAALGISTYAIREGARIRDDKEKFSKFAKEMLNINLFTTLIAYGVLLIFLCLPILKNYKILLIILSGTIVFTTIGMEWLFVIKEEYAYITKRAILFQFLSLILLFLLVRSKEDYGWYAALTVISSGGSAIWNLVYSRKLVNWRQKITPEYKKHLKPIFLIFGTSIASSIYMTMDTTMLGAMSGDKATGIYTAAVKINTVVSTLIGTISSTILPRVSYYIGNGLKKEYEKLMQSSMDLLMMIAMPVAIGMMCTSDILILLFSGAEFLPGSTAAKILSAKVVIAAINRVLAYQICIPYKRDKEVLLSTSGGALFNLIANAALIPIWGVNGASIATFFSEVVVFIILFRYTHKYFPVHRLYARGPIYLAASIWFFLCRYILDRVLHSTVVTLMATVAICAAGYFVILLAIKDPYLKSVVQGAVKRVKKGTGKREDQ